MKIKELKESNLIKNAFSLYVLSFAKLILPLLTFPYLTRVLTKDCYGMISYVKAVMSYMQLIVDFGFLLSGVRDIVNVRNDKKHLNEETWNILTAKIILATVAGIVLLFLSQFIEILKNNLAFVSLSFGTVFLSCFLFDFLFRGIEQMHVITIRFIIMKSISTALTFVLVKSDADIMWIPILDILGSGAAILLVFGELKKLDISYCKPKLKTAFKKIAASFIYFLSDFSTTAFTALNTLIIGIYLNEAEVADWSFCLSIVGAIQMMYNPIFNGIYPEMVRSKRINLIKRIIKIFLPLIIGGCIFTYFIADYAVVIVGGSKYVNTASLLRSFIPLLFVSFFSMLYGWPVLGAIDRAKEATISTVSAAVFQIIGLGLLVALKKFTLVNLVVLRCGTEFLLFVLRYSFYYKNRTEFSKE